MENTTEVAVNAGQKTVEIGVDTLFQITKSSVYLMGFSFIAGSCFTVLILMLLDYMRLRREGKLTK